MTKNSLTVKKKSFSIYLLLILMLFQAISGIGGGIVLLIDPTGDLMGLPDGMLDDSPFTSFLIPGLFLFCILGLFPLFLCYSLIWKPNILFFKKLCIHKEEHWSWNFAVYIGLTLILWIIIEMQFIGGGDILQTIYATLGLVIVFLAILPKVMQYYNEEG